MCVWVCVWVSGCALYSKLLKVLNKNRKALHRSVPSTNNLKNSTRIALCVMTTRMQFLRYRPALLFYENISKCLKLNHVFDNCKLFFSRWFNCSSILRAWRRAVFPLTLIFRASSICSTLYGHINSDESKVRSFFPFKSEIDLRYLTCIKLNPVLHHLPQLHKLFRKVELVKKSGWRKALTLLTIILCSWSDLTLRRTLKDNAAHGRSTNWNTWRWVN